MTDTDSHCESEDQVKALPLSHGFLHPTKIYRLLCLCRASLRRGPGSCSLELISLLRRIHPLITPSIKGRVLEALAPGL